LFLFFWLLQGSFFGSFLLELRGNFRQNGTQLALLEYHARLDWCVRERKLYVRKDESGTQAGRQPKYPAFENREDRGSLSGGSFREYPEEGGAAFTLRTRSIPQLGANRLRCPWLGANPPRPADSPTRPRSRLGLR
jgi:hypothetical protein